MGCFPPTSFLSVSDEEKRFIGLKPAPPGGPPRCPVRDRRRNRVRQTGA